MSRLSARPGAFAAAVAAAVLLMMAAPPAQARQISLGVAGGPAFATGELGDAVGSGLHGGVVFDLGLPLLPFGVRGDLMVQSLPGVEGREDGYRHVAGNLNARVSLLPLPMAMAYVTAGLGVYASDFRADLLGPKPGWGTEPGLNLGVGGRLNLLVVRPFAELRLHRVMTRPTRTFVPLTIGVLF